VHRAFLKSVQIPQKTPKSRKIGPMPAGRIQKNEKNDQKMGKNLQKNEQNFTKPENGDPKWIGRLKVNTDFRPRATFGGKNWAKKDEKMRKSALSQPVEHKNEQKMSEKNSKNDQKNEVVDPKIEKWPIGRGRGGVGEGAGPQKCVFR
jgi:hypothetical protein